MNGKVLIGAAAVATLAAAVAAVLVWSVPPGEEPGPQAGVDEVPGLAVAGHEVTGERAVRPRASEVRNYMARNDGARSDGARPASVEADAGKSDDGAPAEPRPARTPLDDGRPVETPPEDDNLEDAPPEDARPDEPRREEAPHADPVHREVLGRRGWMAPLPPEEIERIDRTIDEAERRRDELFENLELRRIALAQAQQVGEVCFDALFNRVPQASGRVIVNFEAIAHQGGVTITNTRVAANVGLQDLAFENCLITGIDQIVFGTDAPDGAVWLEHAMFFEE